jgi:predicted Zn finger-like uncharacterized protein
VKFLCDRCNTRYSIGDDRVRGKILKIRCKHCSNVITVREGMGITENSIVGPLPDGQARMKKSTIAPEALDERQVSGLLKIPAARTDAPVTRPLRPTGTSTSPGLASAVAAPAVAPPRPPEPAPAPPPAPPPPALEEEWYVSIDGVQAGPFSLAQAQQWVGQKPFDADLHCWSEGFDDWLPVDKVSHFRGLRRRPSAPPAPPRARPAPPAAPPPSAAPTPLPASESTPKPLFAATLASIERAATPSAPRASASPAFGTAVPPAFDTGDLADDPDARTQLQPSPAGGSDDDLDIGEVSRVVNLADLARTPSRRASTIAGPGAVTSSRATGAQPALRATGAQPALRATGAQTALAGADLPIDLAAGLGPELPAPPTDAIAPVATSHRRGLIVLLGAAAVLVIAVIIALTVTSSSDDSPTADRLRPVNDFDTSRPDDPAHHLDRPVPGQTGSGSAIATRPTPHRPTVATPPAAHDPETPPIDALRGDEIEAVARKYQDLTQRCYMRSQRGADAILVGDVKKIAVTLQIDKDGAVSDVQLSDHAADTLGKCLSAAIKGWKFRASSGGRFKFSLNFISS